MEKNNRPKTAIVAFAQQLINQAQNTDIAQTKTEQNKPSSSIINSFDETQLYLLPSGKKCRFIPKTIDSALCQVWKGNARIQDNLDQEKLESLKTAITAQGQLVPILARALKNNENFTHEVIYGSRRLKACQELKIQVKILEANIEDRDALFFMDAENASREDLSIYEKALIYKKWLDCGYFKSQEEVAKNIGCSRRWVNKLLGFFKMPEEFFQIIPDLKEINKPRLEFFMRFFGEHENAMEILKAIIKELKSKQNSYNVGDLILRIKKNINEKRSGLDWQEKIIETDVGERVLTIKRSVANKVKIDISTHLSPERLSKLLLSIEKIAKRV